MQYLGTITEKKQNDLCLFPRQAIQYCEVFNYCEVIQVYALTVMLKKLKLNDSMKTYKTF